MKKTAAHLEGTVLILALGILTVLVLIAATLTVITLLNTTSVTTYIDEKQASVVARAGIEEFIREAKYSAIDIPIDKSFVEQKPTNTSYREEYIDANYNLAFDKGEALLRDNDMDGRYDAYSPLETNPTPTMIVDKNDLPMGSDYSDRVALIKGHDYDTFNLVGVSSYPETTHSPGSEFSSIKALPSASQIYINGPCSKKNVLDNNVIGMLNTLGDVLTDQYKKDLQSGNIKNVKDEPVDLRDLGYLVAALRYTGPFYTENDLKDKKRAENANANNPFKGKTNSIRSLNDTECDLLRDFITTAMWMDYTTLNPAAITKSYGTSTAVEEITGRGFAEKNIQNTGAPEISPFAYVPDSKTVDVLAEDIPATLRGWSNFKPVYTEIPYLNFYTWCFSTYTLRTGGGTATPNRVDIEEVDEKENETTTSIGMHLNQSANLNDAGVIEPKDPLENPGMNDEFIQPRAPISINTAPREVLFSVIYPTWKDSPYNGLAGVYIDKERRNTVNPGMGVFTLPFDKKTAAEVVEKIMEYRREKPFTTWTQFNKFVEEKLYNTLQPDQRALIKANANPNSTLSDFNPDRNLGGSVKSLDYTSNDPDTNFGRFAVSIDKGNLLTWSTEFCFSSMGYYEVECIGRVCEDLSPYEASKVTVKGGPVKRVLSEKKINTILCVYDVYKHSTQKDFESYAFQKIQGGLYKCSSHISDKDVQSRGMNAVTSPENMNNINPNREIVNDTMGENHILSYEEGYESSLTDTVSPAPGWQNGADYDGYLKVKTNDIPYNKSNRATSSIFAADYNDSLNGYGRRSGSGKPSETILAEGTANDKRSLVDNSYDESDGTGQVEGSLTFSTLHDDGIFADETCRYPYFYYDNAGEDTYGDNLNYKVYDEYTRYKTGIVGSTPPEQGLDSYAGQNGFFRPTGCVEMWFKPAWDVYEQFEGDLMTDEVAKDARVFFSLGTGQGVTKKSWTQVSGERRIEYYDPVSGATLVVYRNWPDPTWYTQTTNNPAAQGSGQVIQEVENITREEKTEQSSSQVIFFAANRELSLFFSDNLEMNETDPTGNFKKASLPLDYTPWKWRAGTWHHLAFVFDGVKPVGVFLDGYASTNVYEPSSVLALTEECASMFIGNNRVLSKSVVNGNPANADGTIDSFRVYNYPLSQASAPFDVPDRYDSKYEEYEEYYYQADIVDFAKYIETHDKKPLSGIIGSVFWTEYMPIESSGADVRVEITSGDVVYPGQDSELPDGLDSQTYSNNAEKMYDEDGSFVTINKPVTFDLSKKTNTIQYKLKFKLPDPPDGVKFVAETPIVDDIYVTFITTPRIIAQWEEPVYTARGNMYTAKEVMKGFNQEPDLYRDKQKVDNKGGRYTPPGLSDVEWPDNNTGGGNDGSGADSGDGSSFEPKPEDGTGDTGTTDTVPGGDSSTGGGDGSGSGDGTTSDPNAGQLLPGDPLGGGGAGGGVGNPEDPWDDWEWDEDWDWDWQNQQWPNWPGGPGPAPGPAPGPGPGVPGIGPGPAPAPPAPAPPAPGGPNPPNPAPPAPAPVPNPPPGEHDD